jgi:hypothetical protein
MYERKGFTYDRPKGQGNCVMVRGGPEHAWLKRTPMPVCVLAHADEGSSLTGLQVS